MDSTVTSSIASFNGIKPTELTAEALKMAIDLMKQVPPNIGLENITVMASDHIQKRTAVIIVDSEESASAIAEHWGIKKVERVVGHD